MARQCQTSRTGATTLRRRRKLIQSCLLRGKSLSTAVDGCSHSSLFQQLPGCFERGDAQRVCSVEVDAELALQRCDERHMAERVPLFLGLLLHSGNVRRGGQFKHRAKNLLQLLNMIIAHDLLECCENDVDPDTGGALRSGSASPSPSTPFDPPAPHTSASAASPLHPPASPPPATGPHHVSCAAAAAPRATRRASTDTRAPHPATSHGQGQAGRTIHATTGSAAADIQAQLQSPAA